jgi:L-ascorbate metabolism protein UlaG (beta-lactamase superfamily)
VALLALPFLLGAALAEGARAQTTARITYIGNEGFMVAAGGQGVIIDGLVRRGIRPYVKAEPEQRDRLERAVGAFAEVRLVLATHHHADHFDAEAVRRFLEHNPLAVFVSTERAVQLVVEEGPVDPGLRRRLIAATPLEGETVRYNFDGVELEVLNLHHGRDRQPQVDNLGFLVDVGGFRVLHVGDTEATFEELMEYRLAESAIDAAFIPYWNLVWGEEDLVERAIAPGYLVAMHLPAAGAPASYFGEAGESDELVRRLAEAYPDILIFGEPMESRTVVKPVSSGAAAGQ